MTARTSALGSGWTIAAGLVLVAVGGLLFSLGDYAVGGWFTYWEPAGQNFVPPARLGAQQLVGLAVVGLGLTVAAGATGFRIGTRSARAAQRTERD